MAIAIPDKTSDEEQIYIDSNLPIGGINAVRNVDGSIVLVIAQKQMTHEQALRLQRDLRVVLDRIGLWVNEVFEQDGAEYREIRVEGRRTTR